MKICKNCIYCVFNSDKPDYSKCKIPTQAAYSVITGELLRNYCESERGVGIGKCGPEAINFSPMLWQFNMLMKQIIEELYLDEGLEISHEIQMSINHLIRMWNFDGKVMYENIDNTIRMDINEPINIKKFDIIIKHIENFLGYFPSHITTQKSNFKYDYNKAIELVKNRIYFGIYFDAKYDQEITEKTLPDFLYHIATAVHEDKILKIGLVPKKKNKMSIHPDRIYLTFTSKAAEGLLTNEPFKKEVNEFILFSINFKKLKKVRKIRFFIDPMYVGKGCYTYENIPPQYLTIVKRINI